MTRHTRHFVRIALSLAAGAVLMGSSTAFADVHILGSQGPNYQSIQDAVDAALPGETLIIGGDAYEGFTIDGKGLTLIGPSELPHSIQGTVVIRNVPAGSSVQLDGLHIQGRLWLGDWQAFQNEDALVIEQNAGAVRLYNCVLAGGSGPFDEFNEDGMPHGGAAALVTDSTDVAFLGSRLIGGNGAGNPTNEYDGYGGDGAAGLAATNSAVALYDTELVGGDGGSAGIKGGHGGHGASISGLGVFASGCSFEGGSGGWALDFIYVVPGNGGHGLSVELNTSARIVDNTYSGGIGGYSSFGDGQAGLPKYWAGGPLDETPGINRSLSVTNSLVADGEPFQLQVIGAPGDRIYLALGDRPTFKFTTNPPGVRLVPHPKQIDWLSTVVVGPSGSATLSLPTNDNSTLAWSTRIAQVRAIPAGGGAAYGGSVLLTQIDDEVAPDCNGNGQLDLVDVMNGLEPDCNGDLVPDSCTVTGDCDNNGIDDQLDVECGGASDVNGNLIPDSCESTSTIYVDAAAAPGGDGSIGAPVNNLLAGVSRTLDGWSLELAGGNYLGAPNRNLNLGGRSLHIYSPGGPGACTIDLEQDGYALTPGGADATVQLTGITIKNGEADGSDAGALWSGVATSFILRDCVFEACSSQFGSGAISGFGVLDVADCEFRGNASPGGWGGAIYFGGSVSVTRSHFEENHSYRGGALQHWSSAGGTDGVELSHSTFVGNTAGAYGGALSFHDGVHRVDNCLFNSNAVSGSSSFGTRGGAIQHLGPFSGSVSILTITNSTFVDNTVGKSTGLYVGGGAVYVGRNARTIVLNSILWGNTATPGAAIRVQGETAPALLEIGFSDLEFGVAGVSVTGGSVNSANILDVDPLFVNPSMEDFRLGVGSPCIDAGNDSYLADDLGDQDGDGSVTEVVPVDLAGMPREVDDPAVVDTGVGNAPLTDMGAYERP